MQMDVSRGGGVGRLLAISVPIVALILALLGGVYSFSQALSNINQDLDRNCRILATLDQDIRIHAITKRGTRRAFAPFPDVTC